MAKLLRNESGQMTVEFVVVFPVMIIVALIATNAGLFFSECASFDRLFRQAVVVYGISPGANQSDASAAITQELQRECSEEWLSVEVSRSGGAGGLVTYRASLAFTPTLFGGGTISSVFGVGLPKLMHYQEFCVDAYKPGVLI